MAKKGVARRTRLTVHDGFGAFRGRAAGNTSKTSPPLAGWKVRRLPSVPAAVSHEPFLAKVSRHRKLSARLLKLIAPTTPLQADGLSRRVYPFLGLAIVGLAGLHGYAGMIASPFISCAGALHITLDLNPPRPANLHTRSSIRTTPTRRHRSSSRH